jgi:hypothetical protein
MKTRHFLLLVIVFSFISALSLQAQQIGFNGAWKLNKEKTTMQGGQIFLSKISVKVAGDSLYTTRTYENTDGQEYPFTENLSLDGKESKIVIYEMPRVTKANRSGSGDELLLDSNTTFYRDNQEVVMNSKETWKIEAGEELLSINFTTKMGDREFAGVIYFDRVKQ